MNSLILLGSIQCLLLLLFVYQKKNKSTDDYILIALFAFFGALFGFLYYTQEFNKPHLTAYLINTGLLIAGLFSMYIQKLLDHKLGFRLVYLGHFLPYLLSSAFLFPWYFLSAPDVSFYTFLHAHTFIHEIFRYLNIAIGPACMLFFIIIYRRHKADTCQVLSSAKDVDKAWIRNVMATSLVLWLLTAVINKLVAKFLLPNFTQLYGISWGLSALLFVYIGYKGFKHRSVFFDLPNEPVHAKAEKKYGRSGLKEQDFVHLSEKINTVMTEKKPYLDPELTIYDFAAIIGVPPYHVSQILNEYFKLNFYDFMNQFRIEEFKTQVLLPENRKYSIQSIAFDCGFNSKATFYRIFKEKNQQTPTQFIESATNL